VPRSRVSRCAGRSGYPKVALVRGNNGSARGFLIEDSQHRRIGVTPQERRDMPLIICACAITGFILFGAMIYRLVS
jgi:hypothetical protein